VEHLETSEQLSVYSSTIKNSMSMSNSFEELMQWSHFANYCLFVVGNEIAFADEVQKSLSSPSCDAKAVVLQLQKTKQLDEASLKEPDLETKTLIQCFVRRAKDSNRLDVARHLRKTTPAGTTGKAVKLVWFVSVRLHVFYCPRSILEGPIPAPPATLVVHVFNGSSFLQLNPRTTWYPWKHLFFIF